MGFWSSVSSLVSSACSVIGSVASKIGSEIAGAATSIANLGVSLAEKVGEAIKNVGISLGVIRPEDNLEELGEKAMLSEKTPDDFNSINEYIEHLKDDVVIDKEKFDSLSDVEKLARSSIGASITLKGINAKLDTVVSPSFMATVAAQDLDAKEIIGTIKAYKEKSLSTDHYSLYLKDELSIDESHKHGSALVEAYRKLEPELTTEQIEDKVMELKS
ncbi:hypothetical protein OAY_09360 [Vibrio cyclitrophicus ZF205]|jgi:hypothetical protein|uniref:hypothetical protein n=1 Tax=Vibrio TaxID=662 RepID=UPI00031B9611|nr:MULTISPECIES: hypothetical protein [Vibrio]OEE19260.1 hypothetical protein OAY_09360 [Vibrio cyclitrophicus ZF205]PMF12497.1 hypothetical protein BCV24_15550 [Vibrio cyclitrophicus]PMO09171.1 hypothetical protein BCT18_21405 [Vibrio cyclitrophicus]QCI72075.1 hypothetical protein FAZ90_13900 [Vibrio cyclitrophicus]